MKKTNILLILFVGLAFMATTVSASDLPKRKAGLWEIEVQMAQVPSMGPMQQCIDANTDDLMQQEAQKQTGLECDTPKVDHSGDTWRIKSVCKTKEMTAHSDATFKGDFDSAYTGEVKGSYDPPLPNGMKETNITMKARWIGPCKEGQKPGEVIMPEMDRETMMKDLKNHKMMQGK